MHALLFYLIGLVKAALWNHEHCMHQGLYQAVMTYEKRRNIFSLASCHGGYQLSGCYCDSIAKPASQLNVKYDPNSPVCLRSTKAITMKARKGCDLLQVFGRVHAKCCARV